MAVTIGLSFMGYQPMAIAIGLFFMSYYQPVAITIGLFFMPVAIICVCIVILKLQACFHKRTYFNEMMCHKEKQAKKKKTKKTKKKKKKKKKNERAVW